MFETKYFSNNIIKITSNMYNIQMLISIIHKGLEKINFK